MFMKNNSVKGTLVNLPLLIAIFCCSYSIATAETIHEERSKYRDITVTQVGDRRCLSLIHISEPTRLLSIAVSGVRIKKK